MTRTMGLMTRMTTELTAQANDGDRTTCITITVAARRCGLAPRTVRRYIRRGLVNETLAEADLAELRRIRRLTDLGMNLAGVEIVLQMRERIEELQAEVDHLQAIIDRLVGGAGRW
jgi:MerR family transcriptional regulator/heat shock protein HspR